MIVSCSMDLPDGLVCSVSKLDCGYFLIILIIYIFFSYGRVFLFACSSYMSIGVVLGMLFLKKKCCDTNKIHILLY